MTRFIIIDSQTGHAVSKGYSNRRRAINKADKLDYQYGAYRYRVESVEDGKVVLFPDSQDQANVILK